MPLQRTKVLVLNSSYEPLSICDARRAVLLLFCGKAVPVAYHHDKLIRSASTSMPMPSVVRLTVFIRLTYRRVLPTRKNLLRRDGFRCQYCGRSDLPLTIDHVVPRSREGDDSWENLTTACTRCNCTKGSRTPQEAGMTLLSRPVNPGRVLLLQQSMSPASEEWKPYLFTS
jgi:5-methylcytosine-specific restriction endonuclease McrA